MRNDLNRNDAFGQLCVIQYSIQSAVCMSQMT